MGLLDSSTYRVIMRYPKQPRDGRQVRQAYYEPVIRVYPQADALALVLRREVLAVPWWVRLARRLWWWR